MHRIALSLSAYLFICTPATAERVAQQRDRLPEAQLLDCGYVCVFAQSTQSVQDLDGSAAVRGQSPQWASVPAETLLSQVIPANLLAATGSP
jgi:hypothetical protein